MFQTTNLLLEKTSLLIRLSIQIACESLKCWKALHLFAITDKCKLNQFSQIRIKKSYVQRNYSPHPFSIVIRSQESNRVYGVQPIGHLDITKLKKQCYNHRDLKHGQKVIICTDAGGNAQGKSKVDWREKVQFSTIICRDYLPGETEKVLRRTFYSFVSNAFSNCSVEHFLHAVSNM